MHDPPKQVQLARKPDTFHKHGKGLLLLPNCCVSHPVGPLQPATEENSQGGSEKHHPHGACSPGPDWAMHRLGDK